MILKGPKSAGFSHGHFDLVVQAFHDAAGELLSFSEIVADQFAVVLQRLGNLLRRFDARKHHQRNPQIQGIASPSG